MKKLFYLSFIIPILVFSQDGRKYIVLDSLQSKYKIEKYTLNTKSLYKVDTEIEMYNVMIGGDAILLISILPDLYKNEPKWEKIEPKQMENKIISHKELHRQIIDITHPYHCNAYTLEAKNLGEYLVIKKENNQYYKARFGLVEWFYIVNFKPYMNVSQPKNCILNLGQRPIKRIDFEYVDNKESFFVPPYLRNIYLSNIEEKDGEKLYRFWTFDGWNVQDGYNEHRGIDRFAYIPSKGIVGGSYDFYFGFKSPWAGKYAIDIKFSPEQWKENREQEKIMWAKELFPEKQ